MKAIILNLIPWLVVALCGIGVVYIILRKIPVLLKLPKEPDQPRTTPSFFERLKLKIKGFKYSSQRLDFSSWVEKALRKLRLFILKMDNLFVVLIGRSRERSQIWRARSRAWMEQHQMKKIQKLQVLEKLDQAEVLEGIKKTKEEAEKLKEKKEVVVKEKEEDEKKAEEKKYIELIAQDPRNVEAYKRLGFLYLEQGSKEDAKNCFRRVLKLDPGDMEVISKMKEII